MISWVFSAVAAMPIVSLGQAETGKNEASGSISYNAIRPLILAGEGTGIAGIECGALFVRNREKGVPLDPTKANFRLKTWEEEEFSLTCEALASVPDDPSTGLVKRMVGEGYTHRLWIPRAGDKFLDGEVIHALPGGSLEFSAAAGKLRLKGKQVELVVPDDAVVRHADNRPIGELKKAAERGDAEAQNNLGFLYWSGEGVPQDFKSAFKWYSKSADQGLAGAKYNLGILYDEGQGVTQDHQKATELFLVAGKDGFLPAQCKLAVRYMMGKGVSQDIKKAFEWYSKAAVQGDVDSQYNLGRMYDVGEGVEKDARKAVEWYSKAAFQGDAGAQFNLAVGYFKGYFGPQDFKQSYAWAHVAEASGDPRNGPTATELKRVLSTEFLKAADLEEANALGVKLRQSVRLP